MTKNSRSRAARITKPLTDVPPQPTPTTEPSPEVIAPVSRWRKAAGAARFAAFAVVHAVGKAARKALYGSAKLVTVTLNAAGAAASALVQAVVMVAGIIVTAAIVLVALALAVILALLAGVAGTLALVLATPDMALRHDFSPWTSWLTTVQRWCSPKRYYARLSKLWGEQTNDLTPRREAAKRTPRARRAPGSATA